MTRSNLHHEAGGNPARAPLPDEANQPHSPQDGSDFPDVPEANRSAFPTGRPSTDDPDQPDLDRFADRLGISATDDEPDERPSVVRAPKKIASRAEGLLGRALSTFAQGLRSSAQVADRLSARVRDRQQR